MPTTEDTTSLKRPYLAPELIVHGPVQDLTRKVGTDEDQDGGSFIPDGSG